MMFEDKKYLILRYNCRECGFISESYLVLHECPVCKLVKSMFPYSYEDCRCLVSVEDSWIRERAERDMIKDVVNFNINVLFYLVMVMTEELKKGNYDRNPYLYLVQQYMLVHTFEHKLISVKNVYRGLWIVKYYSRYYVYPFGERDILIDCFETMSSLMKMDEKGWNWVSAEVDG